MPSEFNLSKKNINLVKKIILRVLRTYSQFSPTIPILLLQSSLAPQLRPYLRGISTPCMGHFILPSAALKKGKVVDEMTPFHPKNTTRLKLIQAYKKVLLLKKKGSVEVAAAAADPWRALGADDGAAVPVSGVCASAA